MLVVIAITAILLTLLFIPLSKTIDLVATANARVKGQDSVRNAVRKMTRELGMAMEVFEPRPIEVWGFNNWSFVNQQWRPNLAGLQPERYIVSDGMIAFRLPRHRYYCTEGDHFVTPADIDLVIPSAQRQSLKLDEDAVALDTCPRHPGSAVELRPMSPLEPDHRIVAYFVGLKDPTLRWPGAGNPPFYRNFLLFGTSGNANLDNNRLNTYALFRVEFDPSDPDFANWTTNGQPDGPPNPDFFYDMNPLPSNGATTFAANWRANAVQIMDAETADAVRWLEVGGRFIPHSLCSGGPSGVDEETAQPNRSIGQFALAPGQTLPNDLPPLEYLLDYGNWTGVQSDAVSFIRDGATLTNSPVIPGALLMTPTPINTTQRPGPRIQITDPTTGTKVYDSAAGALSRGRLVGFDSVTGKVVLGIHRADPGNANAALKEYFRATIVNDPNTQDPQVNLNDPNNGDGAVDANNTPSGFRSALAAFPTTRIVPGSDVVVLSDDTPNPASMDPLRRAGWTGISESLDRPLAPSDLKPNEYLINYRTGVITLSPQAESEWSQVAAGSLWLLVKYTFQTNAATDIVRVSYRTRELATVQIGDVEFTRRQAEVLPFTVSERVVIRNLKR